MKIIFPQIIVLIFLCCQLFFVGCSDMLSGHPVDKAQSILRQMFALYIIQPEVPVSGRVVLCSLNKAGNPNVRMTLNGLFETRTVYTDNSGNFNFGNVRPGGYTLSAYKQGHRFLPESQPVSVGGSGANNLTFETMVTWDKKIGGQGWEKAYSVEQTNDCGYVVAGYTDSHDVGNLDFYIIKLDLHGTVEWEKRFGGTNTDAANSVFQTPDRGYITAGYTYSFGAGVRDYWVLRLNPLGTMIWQKTYGGASWDEALSVRPTSDNGFIVAGTTEWSGAGGGDFWVIKLDASGEILWDRTYGDVRSDEAYSIRETSDGGFILCGNSQVSDSGNYDIKIIKINSIGEEQWSRQYDKGNNDEAREIQEIAEGGYIIAGYAGGDFRDAWLIKLDAAGDIVWEKIYGAGYSDKAYSVSQTSDGGYITAGYTYSIATTDNDMFIMKLDSSGNQIWRKIFDGDEGGEDAACSVRQASDGGYIVAGYTTSYVNKKDIWVLKLNENGEIDQ